MFKDIRNKLANKLNSIRPPKFFGMEETWESTSRDQVFLTIMAGVYDQDSVLSKLRGIPHLVRLIYELSTNESWWKQCIQLPEFESDADFVKTYRSIAYRERNENINKWNSFLFLTELREDQGYSWDYSESSLEFPPPKDININMMPFILASDFGSSKLPKYLKPYWSFIHKCSSREHNKKHSMWFNKDSSQIGKICYLTIQENVVEPGKSQRRPGVHVDCPGIVKLRASDKTGGNEQICEANEGHGSSKRYRDHHWGLGGCFFTPPLAHAEGQDEEAYLRSFELRGGIFMASNVEESCRAWNCKIVPLGGLDDGSEDDADNKKKQKKKAVERNLGHRESGRREAIGKLGSLEHLRHLLPDELAQTMKANQMYWMTDRTPHESLPLKTGTYRQFFRLVMSDVSLWYEDHSTPNPNGVKPDPNITKIVKGSKFDAAGVEVVE